MIAQDQTGEVAPLDRRGQFTALAVLALAIFNWFALFGRHGLSHKEIAAIIAGILVFLIPAVGNGILRITSSLADIRERHRALIALSVFFIVAAILLCQVYATGSELFPRLHDEHVYLIQSRMLSIGKLWLPPFPPAIRPFFDEFYLINDPVYAPMYFPGTGLLMMPGLLLGLPYWITPFVAASISAVLLYLVVTELLDSTLALLSVFLLVAVPAFRNVALLMLSQMPCAMMLLLILWAWLRFRRSPGAWWSALLGGAMGFAAIIRPLDGACFAIPLLIAICLQLRGERKQLTRSISVVITCALPFLLFQAIQNTGVTGHWWEFAESAYNARNFPAPIFGFHAVDPSRIPHFASPAKNQAMRDFALPSFAAHEFPWAITSYYPDRFKSTLTAALPDSLLVIFMPVGILLHPDPRRWVFATLLGFFLVGYALFVFYLPHYVVPIIPVSICLTLFGVDAIANHWPLIDRTRPAILTPMVILCLASLPPFQKLTTGSQGPAPNQSAANTGLAQLLGSPVVFFKFDPTHMNWPDDPVYNDTTADPDSARIIRVWDLGEDRDQDLIHYYTRLQLHRTFYRYDMQTKTISEIN